MSGSPGTGGSNPRKFSEKIALHNQKQAEETRAFEQLMTDLNVSRVNTQWGGIPWGFSLTSFVYFDGFIQKPVWKNQPFPGSVEPKPEKKSCQ